MNTTRLILNTLLILLITDAVKAQGIANPMTNATAPPQESQNGIGFSYDRGGNMIERGIQVMMGARMAMPSKKDSLPPPNFKVYPNPTNDFLNIEGKLPENTKKATIIISTLSGLVIKQDVYTGETKQIPVNDLAKGMYLLEFIYSKKQKDTYKIVVN